MTDIQSWNIHRYNNIPQEKTDEEILNLGEDVT